MSVLTASTTFDECLGAEAVARCRHCAEPCRDSPLQTDHGVFCCAGCEAVFAVIAAHGLTAFYTCDVNPGVSQRTSVRDPERYAELDEPATARRLIDRLDDGRGAVSFHVPSLHCASCLWLLEQLWRFHPGIARSEADLMRRSVRVEFWTDRVSLRAIAEQLAALGYAPVLDGERAAAMETPGGRRDLYLKIGVAGFAFGNVMLFSVPRYLNGAPIEGGLQRIFDILNILFAIPVLLYSASPYWRASWAAFRARAITLEVPVALGLVVLFIRSVVDISMGWGEGFLDSFSGLVFFLLIGRLFQQKAFESIAFDRTARSFFPLSVRVERGGAAGEAPSLRITALNDIARGDVMVIRPHEVVPADAVLLDPHGTIDFAFVTGESAPAAVQRGDEVQAGGRVVDRALRLAALQEVSHSRLAQLWDHPIFARPKPQRLAAVTARFGLWFVAGALALAAAGAAYWWPDARLAAQVATAVLIIACPCALTLAAPITFGTGMGWLGRAGCYLKNAAVALDLSRIDTVVFDKTGTLTTGEAGTSAVVHGLTAEEERRVRRLAAESVHPVSRVLAGRTPLPGVVRDVVETPGTGIQGLVDGMPVSIRGAASGTVVRVGASAGSVELSAAGRHGIDAVVAELGDRNEIWLLSGDRDRESPRWRTLFGDRMRFQQTPDDKLAFVRELQGTGRRVLMIGDGLNDAGALAAADVGIAVSDDTACLVPACDAVVRGDRLTAMPAFLRYARLARRVVKLCFAVSVVYNAAGLALALSGRLTPLATAILMPVSSLTIVGLSAGCMRAGGRKVLPR